MRFKSIFWFILLFVTACNFQNESSPGSQSTPTPSPVLLIEQSEPSLTPVQTPTVIIKPIPTETSTPRPSASPTHTPTPTPLPKPFELSISLSAVPHKLPFAIVDEFAFIVEDGRFIIMNIGEFTSPQELWQSNSLGDVVQGIEANGDFAFLRADSELLVWNLENMQNPVVVATLSIPNGKPYLDVERNLLYLVHTSTEGSQITTIDLSVSSEPVELGTAGLNWLLPVTAFTISQNHLLLGDGNNIEIFDISDPGQAVPISEISGLANQNSNFKIVEEILYVGTLSGLYVYDVTNFDTPILIGSYSNFEINDALIDGRMAYLFSEVCGFEPSDDGEITGGCGRALELVNFSNPAEPELIGLLRIGLENCECFVESVSMQKQLIFFEAGGNLYVLDLSEFVR